MSAVELGIPVVLFTHSWNGNGIVFGLNGTHYTYTLSNRQVKLV